MDLSIAELIVILLMIALIFAPLQVPRLLSLIKRSEDELHTLSEEAKQQIHKHSGSTHTCPKK